MTDFLSSIIVFRLFLLLLLQIEMVITIMVCRNEVILYQKKPFSLVSCLFITLFGTYWSANHRMAHQGGCHDKTAHVTSLC